MLVAPTPDLAWRIVARGPVDRGRRRNGGLGTAHRSTLGAGIVSRVAIPNDSLAEFFSDPGRGPCEGCRERPPGHEHRARRLAALGSGRPHVRGADHAYGCRRAHAGAPDWQYVLRARQRRNIGGTGYRIRDLTQSQTPRVRRRESERQSRVEPVHVERAARYVGARRRRLRALTTLASRRGGRP